MQRERIIIPESRTTMPNAVITHAYSFTRIGPPTMCGDGRPSKEPVEITCPRCIAVRQIAESLERSIVVDGPACAWKTTALMLAAIHGIESHGFRAVLIFPKPWFNASFRVASRFMSARGMVPLTTDTWTVLGGGGTISVLESTTRIVGMFDFIGVDDIDELPLSDVEQILNQHIKPGGRFRANQSPGRWAMIIDRRIAYLNVVATPEYVEAK